MLVAFKCGRKSQAADDATQRAINGAIPSAEAGILEEFPELRMPVIEEKAVKERASN